jgi:hypothetical protein
VITVAVMAMMMRTMGTMIATAMIEEVSYSIGNAFED